MPYREDINFLKFHTARVPVSIIQNSILHPFYKPLTVEELQKHLRSFVQKLKKNTVPAGVNLYFHIPFCKEICYYCHCSKYLLKDQKDLAYFQEIIYGQIKFYSSFFKEIRMKSLYFGGGTPSLLEPKMMESIFTLIYKNFKFKKNFQFNFEAHPSSLTQEKIKILKKFGVNRLSLGVQALDTSVLEEINRRQTESKICQVLDNIKQAKFCHLNVDLIAGLPKQTTDVFVKDLKRIVQFKPDVIHVIPWADISTSLYLKKRSKIILSEVFCKRLEMVRAAKTILTAKGYYVDDFESYRLQAKAKNYQQFYSLRHASSILGLGSYANTTLFDEVVYKTYFPIQKHAASLSFKGLAVDKKYNMAQFIIMNLLQGFSEKLFENIFKISMNKDFIKELRFLQKHHLITEDRFLKYNGDWSMQSLFDYFAYTKVLYGT